MLKCELKKERRKKQAEKNKRIMKFVEEKPILERILKGNPDLLEQYDFNYLDDGVGNGDTVARLRIKDKKTFKQISEKTNLSMYRVRRLYLNVLFAICIWGGHRHLRKEAK